MVTALKKKISKCFIMLLICFVTCPFLGRVHISANENQPGSLTITCQKDNIILSGLSWEIFRVADITGNDSYEKSGDFKKYPVQLNGLTTSELQTAAGTLEAYTKTDNLSPIERGITDSNGVVTFNNLENGLYLVAGDSIIVDDTFYMPAPSLIVLSDKDQSGVSWQYNVDALPKLKVLPASMRIYRFDCIVKKQWTNDNEEKRPDSVTAVLYKDGEKFDSAVLNSSNNWKHEWAKLSSDYEWTVIEENVPENYTVTYTSSNINQKSEFEHDTEYIINNTFAQIPASPEVTTQPTQKLPQTGQLWWPVPVMSAAGLLAFGTGWKINSRKRKRHEK